MNRLPGTLLSFDCEGPLTLADVDVDGARFTAMLLSPAGPPAGWASGITVELGFRETEVSLAKELSGRLSLRNRQPATVLKLEHGRLMTQVELQFRTWRIGAVITRGSAERLELQVGDRVEWLVKANEMTVSDAL